MQLPDYITTGEVQRVCKELGFCDWTQITDGKVPLEEASALQDIVGAEATQVPIEVFQRGLEIELEHGTEFPDANVTHNHPVLTAMIVLAHLKEMLDYYERLEVAELEGDLLKAIVAGDLDKARAKYTDLLVARRELADAESGAM